MTGGVRKFEVAQQLAAALREVGVSHVSVGTSFADLTTLRVGGPAAVLVVAESDADLASVGIICRRYSVAWAIVGRGSNLLVSDAGWPGVTVQLGRAFRGVEVISRPTSAERGQLRAGAAEPLPPLAVKAAEAGLSGLEWASSVPGSVGGAVRMNAGAHGSDMAASLVEVDIFRLETGMRETWRVEALGLGYRRSGLPADGVVVAATFELTVADPASGLATIDGIRNWRRTHQPLNHPNCGSVFTNPPGDSAGRLIEAAGAKGLRIGGAEVSEKHANFIITRPGATAADVDALIIAVQSMVREAFGIKLDAEVVRIEPMIAGGSQT